MTPSEKIVADLSRSSFLSFWSFPNPKGKKNKELCDILVVCEPDIIIFSVKDISVKRSGNYNVDYDRWKRHAIDESIGQIYGAERIIRLRDEIFLNDGKTVMQLPKKKSEKSIELQLHLEAQRNIQLLLYQNPKKSLCTFLINVLSIWF